MVERDSIFKENIARGLVANVIQFNEDESKITYICSRNYATSFKNPEETVRASYFVELILDYQYPKEKIDIEVKVERRMPDDRADIVIYEDDELKKPYLIVEAKRDGITDSEFTQAIEQAFGNANSKRAKYAIVLLPEIPKLPSTSRDLSQANEKKCNCGYTRKIWKGA